MIEEQPIISVNTTTLLEKAQDYFNNNYRLIQIGCTKTNEIFELNYSFSKDMSFVNLRLNLKECQEVPSISGIYLCAFIYENEASDLFGIKINGIAIDYKGKFYRTVQKKMFATCPVREVKVVPPAATVAATAPSAPAPAAKVEIKKDLNPERKNK